jgi:hypothetical protein
VEGEVDTIRLMLFHIIPLRQHTIHIVRVDEAGRRIETEEHGGVVRRWHHVLQVEPGPNGTSHYLDKVDLRRWCADAAGGVPRDTSLRYRQRRWKRLASRYLQAEDVA